MKIINIFFFFFLLLFFSGCQNKRIIELDSKNYIDILPDNEWIVVNVPYIALRKDADFFSEVVSHARSGDIFLVCGKKRVKIQSDTAIEKRKSDEYSLWYKIEDGWVESSLVNVYDTRLKAESASRKIL